MILPNVASSLNRNLDTCEPKNKFAWMELEEHGSYRISMYRQYGKTQEDC